MTPLTRGSSSESFGIFCPSVLSIHLWCRPLRVAPSRRHGLRRARPRGSRRGATQRRIQVRVTSTSHPRPVLAPRPHRALMPHASTCPLRDLSADLRRVLPFRLASGCGADNPTSARARRPAPRLSPHPPSATPHPTPPPTRTPRSKDAWCTTPPPANSSTSRLASTHRPGRPPSWRSCARSGDSSAGSWPYSSGGTSNQSWTPEGSTSSRYPSGHRNERWSLSMKQAFQRRTSTRIQRTSATTPLN